MNISLESMLVAGILLLYIDLMLVCKLFINKAKKDNQKELFDQQQEKALDCIAGKQCSLNFHAVLHGYAAIQESVITDRKDREGLSKLLLNQKALSRKIKAMASFSKTRRSEAAAYLGILRSEEARKALEKAIVKEKSYPVKLYMANALSDIGDARSLPVLVSTLYHAHRWYRTRANMFICSFEEKFHEYMDEIISKQDIEIIELILDFASEYISNLMKAYLLQFLESSRDCIDSIEKHFSVHRDRCCQHCVWGERIITEQERFCQWKGPVKNSYACRKFKLKPTSLHKTQSYRELVYKAAEIISKFYYEALDHEVYLYHQDVHIRRIAIKALAHLNSPEEIKRITVFLVEDDLADSAIYAIAKIIERNPGYINIIADLFMKEKNPYLKERLARILSNRVEYFIMKLSSIENEKASRIIKEIILLKKVSEVIDFLNRNKELTIENELISIVREVVSLREDITQEFCDYLNDRLIKKCKLQQCIRPIEQKVEKKNFILVRTMYSLLVGAVLLLPLVYVVRYRQYLTSKPLLKQLETFVVDFNYYIAFYAIAINVIYLILLGLSYLGVHRQAKLWRIKSFSMLFKKRVLPSISIIAPAFNEEMTIIESANSLLNLKYPDYELIIVNDGSKDATIEVLIHYFELVRVDYIPNEKLKTKAIRGIFVNPSIPKLIVVDKYNGGKADSLNAGINIAKKEYFCGIDADSLLEEQALLRLASQILDEDFETPALGGNILPINGCRVERGVVSKIRIPQNQVARFQTIEYLRAFMTGRVGWSYINSLLIISGAFGLFRKERVIDIGGYLTSSEKYGKDTVGEDMELVVRISRLMREKGLSYRMCYSYNANCWTEVPEDLKSLKKQRYRWHRGLADILTFHRRVLFNPRYGRMGLIAMPYYFLFELVGPLIEVQGYFMLVLALALGIMSQSLAVLLFVSSVLLGMLVSLSSLVISHKEMNIFSGKDLAKLIFYAIIENFGPRQLFSFWRVSGYLRMLRKPQGWDKLTRKGFSNHQKGVTG